MAIKTRTPPIKCGKNGTLPGRIKKRNEKKAGSFLAQNIACFSTLYTMKRGGKSRYILCSSIIALYVKKKTLEKVLNIKDKNELFKTL